MFSRIRAHVRNNLIGYLALFVALGGSASAAFIAANSVNSRSIVNGQVRRADLANGGVTRPKVSRNAINGAKILNGTVTGADVNEATLGAVPSAGAAGNATLLQGNPPGAFAPASKVLTSGQVAMVGNEAQKTLISNGALSLLADCPSAPGGDRPSLSIKTAAGTTAWFQSTATNPASSSGTIASGTSVMIESFASGFNGGTYNVLASDGKSLSGTFVARGGFQGDGCIFSASAIAG